jgi:aminomethyltransferase
MANFGGWEMPIEYSTSDGGGVIAEHLSVRSNVGLFDVSHLGKIEVSGLGALALLNSIFTNDLTRISDYQAQYTLLCEELQGGVVDDLIIYRYSDERFLLVPNAANCQRVFEIVSDHASDGIDIRNLHSDLAVFALQGPSSSKIIERLFPEAAELQYMSFASCSSAGVEIVICRTGYTGEMGYEFILPLAGVELIWNLLEKEVRDQGGKICGLGARDTLRTEMGYSLHGHEISLEITPIEAGLSWALAFNKESFHGLERLKERRNQKGGKRVRALRSLDRTIPRSGMDVSLGGEILGQVTSGTFSPTLKCGIALALIDGNLKIGEKVIIDIRGREGEYEIIKMPFVESRVHL